MKQSNREVEIKFRIDDLSALSSKLPDEGFTLVTPSTPEMNILYDAPGGKLRRQGAILRLREYGPKWTLTYKDKRAGRPGRHKSRREVETTVANGEAMADILLSLGFRPSFQYEKNRTEWSDTTGHVVVDETPIGNFGEIEGPPQWIDAVAQRLGISLADYITASYAELFLAWKRKAKSKATDMTFKAVSPRGRRQA